MGGSERASEAMIVATLARYDTAKKTTFLALHRILLAPQPGSKASRMVVSTSLAAVAWCLSKDSFSSVAGTPAAPAAAWR